MFTWSIGGRQALPDRSSQGGAVIKPPVPVPGYIGRRRNLKVVELLEGRQVGHGYGGRYPYFRRHIEVDHFHIARAVIAARTADGKMGAKDVASAIKVYKINVRKPNPTGVGLRTPR